MRVLILSMMFLLYGCPPPCQVKATRCSKQIVEVCGSNQKWQRALDCAAVKPIKAGVPQTWTCGELPTGSTCVPVKGQ